MTEIYIVRHGESESNANAVLTGQIDLGLSAVGLRQAECVRNFFENIHIDEIYSSDLIRAYKTVEAVAEEKGILIKTARELREINAGEWQGVAFTDIEKNHGDEYSVWKKTPWNFVFPGGESTAELGRRVFAKIQNIATECDGKTVLISAHSTPIRVFLSIVKTGRLEAMGDIALKNGSVTRLSYTPSKFTIEDFGLTEHLGELITGLPKAF